MRTLPKKIKIGPFNYTFVRSKDDLTADSKKQVSDDTLGLTDIYEQQMFVEKGLANETEKETSLHEVVHVAFYNAGLREILSYNKEERIVNSISQTIFQVLRDNPRYAEYLLEKG